MVACKPLIPPSQFTLQPHHHQSSFSSIPSQSLKFFSNPPHHLLSPSPGSRNQGFNSRRASSESCACVARATSNETADIHAAETVSENVVLEESPEDFSRDTIEGLRKVKQDDLTRLMKMERRPNVVRGSHWFPYKDMFRAGSSSLNSSEILEALDPLILDTRKERMRKVVDNRSYAVCLVVEGLTDIGNVSAICRSADALGFQSVHVISSDSTRRYRYNHHVSMGAEKWLDIELWNSTQECFKVLKLRGYRIATTLAGKDAVSIYDMDWSLPTAIVVGNESSSDISDEALHMSDLRCSIPVKGMVDSFSVSVAAGILMNHAVCDRTSRLGRHGDLTSEENKILLAEFSLRHNRNAICIAHEHAKRKAVVSMPKL